jgi:uncharacterized membrane protein YgcG
MRNTKFSLIIAALCWSGISFAQYTDDEESSPWFGGPGDYVFPVVCTACKVWQDYRNFAWNQLTINRGSARTPTNPGDETSFRIYTNPVSDLFPATVEIELEVVDVKIMGQTIGYRPADGNHYFVETHPENGDSVPGSVYPSDMGPLQFPYASDGDSSGGGSGGGSSGGGGGGDSPSGGKSGGFRGGRGGAGAGGGPRGGYGGYRGGGNYCGSGTEWDCVHIR